MTYSICRENKTIRLFSGQLISERVHVHHVSMLAETCMAVIQYLSTPDLLDRRVVCIQLKGLSAELYGRLCGQQHQGCVEEEAAHQSCTNLHRVYCEHQQVQPHLGCSFDHTPCSLHNISCTTTQLWHSDEGEAAGQSLQQHGLGISMMVKLVSNHCCNIDCCVSSPQQTNICSPQHNIN